VCVCVRGGNTRSRIIRGNRRRPRQTRTFDGQFPNVERTASALRSNNINDHDPGIRIVRPYFWGVTTMWRRFHVTVLKRNRLKDEEYRDKYRRQTVGSPDTDWAGWVRDLYDLVRSAATIRGIYNDWEQIETNERSRLAEARNEREKERAFKHEREHIVTPRHSSFRLVYRTKSTTFLFRITAMD